MEDQEAFHASVSSALLAGAAASLAVWIVWAVSALASAHLPGTWFAAAGAHIASPMASGALFSGGPGLGAGALPVFPVVALFLAAAAARAYLIERRAGKVSVAPKLGPIFDGGGDLSVEPGKVRCAARDRRSPMASSLVPSLVACGSAGIAAGALPWLLPAHPAFGVFIGGMILGLILTRRPVPGAGRGARKLAVVGCGISAVVGVATIEAIASHGWFEAFLPAPLPMMILGSALGGFLVLGTALAHVSTPSDPVRDYYRRRAKELRGELFESARRAHDTYRAAAEVLESRGGDRAEALRLRERLAQVTRRVIDLALQCQSVAIAVGEATELRLAREIAELERKASASTDDVARRHYERARETLATQQAQLDRIRVGRDRAVATIHGQLALLERARLSLIGLASSDYGRLMSELSVVSEALDESSSAMDAESEAMLALSV